MRMKRQYPFSRKLTRPEKAIRLEPKRYVALAWKCVEHISQVTETGRQIIRDSLALFDELGPALHRANAALLATHDRIREVHILQEQLVRLYMQVIAGVNIKVSSL